MQLLPHHIQPKSVVVVEGTDLEPLVTHDFLLVPNPGECDPTRPYRVVFRASRAGD